MMRLWRRRSGASSHIPDPLRSARGLTVLEVMIAALVIAIVAVGSIAFFARGRVLIDHEERKRVATMLAQECLESAVSNVNSIDASRTTREIAQVPYTMKLDVDRNTPKVGIHTLRAEVSWPIDNSGRRDITLTTLVYPRANP